MIKYKGGKFTFFREINSLLLMWIIGIFLFLAMPAMAAPLTTDNIINLTNAEREKFNIPSLKENIKLTHAAQNKAHDILEQQTFAHNFTDKKFSVWVQEQNYDYQIVGENLAIHFNDTVPLFNAWLASPAHKQNILFEKYSDMGVAVVTGMWSNEPTTAVVSIFARPKTNILEPTVPLSMTTSIKSDNVNFTYFDASDLQENYLNNIIINNDNKLLPKYENESVRLASSLNKKTTALFQYVSWAMVLMLIYSAVMIIIVVLYLYSFYFLNLLQEMKMIKQQYRNS